MPEDGKGGAGDREADRQGNSRVQIDGITTQELSDEARGVAAVVAVAVEAAPRGEEPRS